MSNGSEHTPDRCVHAVDGPDWAGLRELPTPKPDYEALIEEVRALFDEGWCVCRSSHLPGDLLDAVEALLRRARGDAGELIKADRALKALHAENAQLQVYLSENRRALDDAINVANGNKSARDALQARLDAMTTDFRLRRTGVVNGKVAEVEPFYEQRLVGPWTVVPEGDANA
jgi:Arc/MetJ family transcription regulator